jgi:LAS superfamily LD-carboxypeptidase LdcB
MDLPTLTALRRIWQGRRPFIALSHVACPAPPPASSLSRATSAEGYDGKPVMLRTRALAAYRAMAAAARAQSPAIARDPRLMTIFSAYRSPEYDAGRCVRDGNCNGIVRARCSAHRTGLAMDIYLGAAPGEAPDSSDDANRLFISQGPAYRWMIHNAGRFGFVNYPFEPWHWEWVGEAP